MRKSKTTSEPCETTESALELQETGNGQNRDLTRGNTIILNPALHSAAATLTSSGGATSGSASTGGGVNVFVRKRTASKKPPALVLTKVYMKKFDF